MTPAEIRALATELIRRKRPTQFKYIANYYGVPAKKGARVTYQGKPGVLVGASHYAHIRLDGEKHVRSYHPTDKDLVWL